MSKREPYTSVYSQFRSESGATVEVVKGEWNTPSDWLAFTSKRPTTTKPAPADLRHMFARRGENGGVILQPSVPHPAYRDIWTPVTVFVSPVT